MEDYNALFDDARTTDSEYKPAFGTADADILLSIACSCSLSHFILFYFGMLMPPLLYCWLIHLFFVYVCKFLNDLLMPVQ